MDYELTQSVIRAALAGQRPAFARQAAERWLASQPGHLTMSVLLAEALLADAVECSRDVSSPSAPDACECGTCSEECDCASGAGRNMSGIRLEARRVLNGVLDADPENDQALGLKIRLHELDGDLELAWAAAAALQQVAPHSLAGRGKLARLATRAPARARHTLAEAQPGTPLPGEAPPETEAHFLTLVPSLAELEHSWRTGAVASAQKLAEQLLSAYPKLVKAHLILADCLMAQGDESASVAHLHQAVGLDPGGEVAMRLWDGRRPYQGAWPPAHVPGVMGPLPHPLASALGLNLLPETSAAVARPSVPSNGRTSRPPQGAPQPAHAPGFVSPGSPVSVAQEALINIQAEINRLAGRPHHRIRRRQEKWVRLQPVYTIITSKARLQAKYGQDGWEQIDGALQALAKAAEARLRLPAGLLYVDDSASLSEFKVDPVDPTDPWAVKTMLNQLDSRLGEQEQEIGWLLLVGGPDVVAFHRLPNPTDDGDADVPSDNPYGCKDENYFVPQRAVGRLPDGADGSPTLLLRSIATALAAQHAARRARRGRLRRWWEMLVALFRGWRPAPQASFGYAASVWRKASLSVFSEIGPAHRLRISPPLTAAEFSGLSMGPSRYGYFNLHGIANGPAWYGQRDPTFPADYPAFPVALRPEDVAALGSVPEVIFSEACYGALAECKSPQTALCLKFLDSGAQMFVGSTSIAYGGLNSSPEAADLLASCFWQEIVAGRSGGVALQQAKVAFAQRLNARQGYLDGEDQKTLLSFVYYGDPTLTAPPVMRGVRPHRQTKRTWKELPSCPPTVCAKGVYCSSLDSVPPDLVDEVRSRVAGYLPGMERAQLAVSRQRACQAGLCRYQCTSCGTDWTSDPLELDTNPFASAAGSGTRGADGPGQLSDRMVFTLRRAAKVAGVVHNQVVKVTVDEDGQMLKLTVSK